MSLASCIKKAKRQLSAEDKAFLERELADGKSDEQALLALQEAIQAEIDLLVGQLEEQGVELSTEEAAAREAMDVEADKKWAKWRPQVTTTGKVMGAPGWVNRAEDPAAALRKMERELRNRLREGETGRYWYEESARRVMDIVGNDVVEAEKLIQIIAIYSPQANVQVNTSFAVKAWNQFQNNEPINVKTAEQDNKATDVLYLGKPYAGRKTNSFYQNLMYELVNQNPKAREILSLDQEILDTLDKSATIDLWMFRAFGFDNESAGDDKGGGAYSFSENYLRRITAKMNRALEPGAPRWTPHQVQAAIWSAMKARYETQWVKDSTNRESARKGHSIRSGKNKYERKGGAEHQRAHGKIWRKWAMKVTSKEAKEMAESTSASYETYIDQMIQSVSWEAMPPSELGLEINDASPEVKAQFMREALAILIDVEGKDQLAQQLGIPLNYVRTGTGAWKGQVNTNVMSHLLPTKIDGGGGFSTAEATAYAQAIQYIFKQGVVPVMRADPQPFNSKKARDAQKYRVIKPDGKTLARSVTDDREKALAMAAEKGEGFYAKGGPMSRGTRFTFRDVLSEEQLDNVVELLSEVFEDVGFSQVAPNQIAIVNYRNENGIPEFSDEAFDTAMQHAMASLEEMGAIDAGTFWSESSENTKADWAADPEGERLVTEANLEGRPALQAWVRDRRQAFEEVLARYSGERLSDRELEAKQSSHLSQLTGYHGTGTEDFEGGRMSTDFIGGSNGVGMFNFGWGLYFSSIEEGGESYRQQIADATGRPGSLWKATLDINEEELLKWDIPLDRQSPHVLKLLNDVVDQGYKYYSDLGFTGGDFYKMLARNLPGGDKEASLTLRSIGIKGITFMTPGRPEWKAPEWNYVVFDDQQVEAIDRLKQVSVYYSALSRAAKGLKQEKGRGDQMLALIRKTPGVKEEEIEWLALEEFLGERKGVTKQEIIDFVTQGGVQVDETVLGAAAPATPLMDRPAPPATATPTLDELTQEYNQWMDDQGVPSEAVGSADEMLDSDYFNRGQHAWLQRFIERWEEAQTAEDQTFQPVFPTIENVPDEGLMFQVEGWTYRYMPDGSVTDGDMTWDNLDQLVAGFGQDPETVEESRELFGAIRWLAWGDWYYGQLTQEEIDADEDYVEANVQPGWFWHDDGDGEYGLNSEEDMQQGMWQRAQDVQRQIGAPDDALRREWAPNATPLTEAQQPPVSGGSPRWASHVTSGGKEYRELLLTIPSRDDGGNYRSGHYSVPNIVAHVRFNERVINGQRVLFIEEIQSDWHQAGRKKGYAGVPATPQKVKEILVDEFGLQGERQFEIWGPMLVDYFNERDEDKRGDLVVDGGWRQADVDRLHKAAANYRMAGVPDGPFKQSWPMLGMKRMIRWAAENNFDRVAWTTGEQQLERWPQLRKRVNRVKVSPLRNNKWMIQGYGQGGNVLETKTVAYDVMETILGTEMAQKAVAGDPQAAARLAELTEQMNLIDEEISALIEPGRPENMDKATWTLNAFMAARDNKQGVFKDMGDSQWRDLVYLVEQRDTAFVEWVDMDEGAVEFDNITLDLGARKMTAFYDEMLVNQSNKYLKKYKSRVEDMPIRDPITTTVQNVRAGGPAPVATQGAGPVSNFDGTILGGQTPWTSEELGRIIFSSSAAVDSYFDAMRAGNIDQGGYRNGDMRMTGAREFLGGAPERMTAQEAEDRTGVDLNVADLPPGTEVLVYPSMFTAMIYPPSANNPNLTYGAVIDRDEIGNDNLAESEAMWAAYMGMWIDDSDINEDINTYYMVVPTEQATEELIDQLETGRANAAVGEGGGQISWEERGSYGMMMDPRFRAETERAINEVGDLAYNWKFDWDNAEILDGISPDQFLFRIPVEFETDDGYFRDRVLIDADTMNDPGDQVEVREGAFEQAEEIEAPTPEAVVPAEVVQAVRAYRTTNDDITDQEVFFWDQATADEYPIDDYRDDVERTQEEYMDYRVPVLSRADNEFRYGWLDISWRSGELSDLWIGEDIAEDPIMTRLYQLYMAGTQLHELGSEESIEALNEFAVLADSHYNLNLQPEGEYEEIWDLLFAKIATMPVPGLTPALPTPAEETYSGTIIGLTEADLETIQTAVAEAVESTAVDMEVGENYVWDNMADIGIDDHGNLRFDNVTQEWYDMLDDLVGRVIAGDGTIMLDQQPETQEAPLLPAPQQPTFPTDRIPDIQAQFDNIDFAWDLAWVLESNDMTTDWIVPIGFGTEQQQMLITIENDGGAWDSQRRLPFGMDSAELGTYIRQFVRGDMSMEEFNEEFGADILTDDNWDDVLGDNWQEWQDPADAAGMNRQAITAATNRVVNRANAVERQMAMGVDDVPTRAPVTIGVDPAAAGEEYTTITKTEPLASIPTVHSFPVTQELRDMAMEGQALFQEKEVERGRYYPDLSGDRVIQLMKASDLSTFLHEGAHFFLDMQMVWARKYRIMTDNQKAILEWLGVTRFEDITREHHEKWAETFEVYLMEGKSPSQKLRRAFSAYKKWLKTIYRQLGLDDPRIARANLDDRARDIFDRLLATEDEIEIAAELPEFKAMYQSLEESGMTEEGWKEYQARAARVKETAEMDIDEKVMKEYKAMKSAQWKREKAPLIEQEKTRLQAEPIYQLMSDLTVVKDEDGTVVQDNRMDWHALRDAVGEIPQGKWIGKAVGGGIDPGQYAEAYGFASVKDMYDKVNNALTLNQAADQAAEGRMIDKHGDILRDGSLEQEVREAMLNEDQAQLVLMELRAAKKDEGWMGELGGKPQTKINRQLMKAEAEEIIGNMVFKQIRPAKYYHAMIKYAQKAARGEDTLQSKLMQLSNHYLYKAALETKERMKKDRARIRAVQSKKYSVSDVSQKYINAMKSLALAYDVRSKPEDRLRYTEAVLDFYEGQRTDEDTGLDNVVMMDPTLALAYEYRKENKTLEGFVLPTFNEMKADDLAGVVQMLNHLRYVGGGEAAEAAAGVAALREEGMISIEENGGKDYKIQRGGTRKDSDEARLTVSNVFHSLTSIPNMVRRLDGFKDGGWAATHILQPLSKAYGAAINLQAEMHDRLDDAMGDVSRVGLSRKDAQDFQTESGETVAFSSEAIFMMGLYWGTESSRVAIMQGHGLTETDVEGLLKRLTQEQLELINAVWSMNESRWPRLRDATKKRFGVAPPKLKPTPFMVNGVQLTGGHMQLFYDSRRVEMKQERQNAMRNAAVIPARAGSTIARVGSGGAPVLLDIHNITRSVDDSVQMIAFAETGKYLADILNNKDFAATIEKKHGPEFYRNLVEAIDAVTANNVHVESNKGWAKLSRWMRGNATMMILAYSIRNVTQQFGALPLAIEEVNPLRFAQASSVMLQDPKGMATTINDFSPFMKNRAQLVNREAREYMRKMMATSKGKAMWEGFRSRGFMFQTMVDATIAYPTWWAKYQIGMDDHGEHDRAVVEADRAVGESVGSGSDIHLGRIMQSNQGEFVKTLTVFGSWFNAYHQRLYRSSKGFTSFLNPRFFMDGILLPIIVANLSQILIMDTPDEEEEWYEWAGHNTFDFLIGTLPGFRDIAAQLKGYSPTAPLYNLFSAPIKLGGSIGSFMEGETSKTKVVEDVGRTMSSLIAMPGSGNVWRALDYIDSYMQGNEPEDFNPYQMFVEGADKNQ